MKERMSVKDLCFMAMYAAIFVVLDYLTQFIPLLKMPSGGSIGLGTIALLLSSYHLGWRNGVMVGLISVPLQYLTGQMYINGIVGLVLDYIVPFGIYGIASKFINIGYFYSGILVSNFVRFLCHVMSGMIIWQTTLAGSIAYNGPYMFATYIVGALVVPLLYNRLKKVIR